MDATTKTALLIAFTLVVVLLLLFGGGTMTGATLSGGMMGNGVMGELSWMWIPALLILSLGVVLVWVIFRQELTDLIKERSPSCKEYRVG